MEGYSNWHPLRPSRRVQACLEIKYAAEDVSRFACTITARNALGRVLYRAVALVAVALIGEVVTRL